MRALALIRKPGAGDRAVLAAVMLALVVLAAVPAAGDAEPRWPSAPSSCAPR
jgi:hypothetical protein